MLIFWQGMDEADIEGGRGGPWSPEHHQGSDQEETPDHLPCR